MVITSESHESAPSGTSPRNTNASHPPLARNAQGHPIAIPDGAASWAIKRETRGRPKVIKGLRVGEIRGLQWTDIKAGQLTVRRALDKLTNESIAPKHNKTRSVPLSPRLAESLEQLPRSGLWVVAEAGGSYVTYDRLSETINALYKRAEVARPPKPVHCMRHTFGSVMAKSVPLPVLRDLMGHADIETTLRYVDVGEDQKRHAIAKVFGVGSQRAAGRTNERGTVAK